MVNRLGVIIVDGRQHTPTVSPTPPTNHPPKPVVSMASHTIPQQLNINNTNQLFVAPPGYPTNNNNMMNNNSIRTVHLPMQNVHSMRPHRYGATMHYAGEFVLKFISKFSFYFSSIFFSENASEFKKLAFLLSRNIHVSQSDVL